MSYLDKVSKPFFVLAPMYDVTDTVFRQIILDCAPPDVLFTEFVNADGLQSVGRENLGFRLRFNKQERPIVAQIWGKNPENFYKTARDLVAMGFDGIDINMGCPDKAVVKNGCCGALINNHQLAAEIIAAAREGAGGKVPVSVKTRIGFGQYDKAWLEFILSKKLPMLSLHLRTVKEMSKVPAHWELAREISGLRDAVSPRTLLVGNGDVESRARGENLAKDNNLDGIMIGRGIFKDPFVFSGRAIWPGHTPKQKIRLYKKHLRLFAKTWTEGERPMITLNKFCKIYVSGFDGAKEAREKLMSAANIDELFYQLNQLEQAY